VALVAGCTPYVQGNGVFHEETRDVPAFRGITVEDGIQAIVRIEPGPQIVRVSGDANVVQQLATEVGADAALPIQVLKVRVVGGDFSSVHPLRLDVRVPLLEVVRLQDATRVEVHGATADLFTVEARDGSTVLLDGAGGALLDVVLAGGQHGGAHLDADLYPVTDASVTLTQSSRVELSATGTVAGTATAGSLVENHAAGVCAVTDPATSAPVSCSPPAAAAL
jgi:hypothetical protein